MSKNVDVSLVQISVEKYISLTGTYPNPSLTPTSVVDPRILNRGGRVAIPKGYGANLLF